MANTEIKELLEKYSVRVRDVELVKKILLKSPEMSQEVYDNLCRITAETGALILPFRELPQVKSLLSKEANNG